MLRWNRKQLGKKIADEFEKRAEISVGTLDRDMEGKTATIATIEEMDRLRGYVDAMEMVADAVGSPYLYKKLLKYKLLSDMYFYKIGELYKDRKIRFYADSGKAEVKKFDDVVQKVKEQVNGR